MQLSLTPRAAEAVRARARDSGVPDYLLRVAVVAGGCNGLTWDLYFVEAPGQEDTVVEGAPGLRVAVDRSSAPLVDGTVIDLRGASFQFDNPRARRECSCGASFEV